MKRNQVTTSSQIGSTKAMLLTLLVAALAAAMLSVTVWPGTSLKQRLSLAEHVEVVAVHGSFCLLCVALEECGIGN